MVGSTASSSGVQTTVAKTASEKLRREMVKRHTAARRRVAHLRRRQSRRSGAEPFEFFLKSTETILHKNTQEYLL